MIVPSNTIAAIPLIENNGLEKFDMQDLKTFLKPLKKSRKRYWFKKDFYKCLPLSIGNMQGFVVSLPFDFDVMWDGGESPESIYFNFYENEKKFRNKLHISINSHFGHGILTIHLPVMLKTPPGINLMTISPPNFPTPGLSAMTGVVESDNLRFTFSLNIKIDVQNTWIKIEKDYPLVGIIPIPRYFCDSFEIVNGYDIFSDDEIEEERIIEKENSIVDYYLRHDINGNNVSLYNKWWDGCYYDGTDIRGNLFSDHQLPWDKNE